MNTMKTKKLTSGFACLVAAILLITAHSVVAQIKIGGIEITIPKRPKTPKTENPVIKVETPVETPVTKNEEAKTKSSPTSNHSNAQSDAWVDDINRKKKEVDDYDSSEPNRAFEINTPYYVPRAVSPRARQEYYKQNKINETRQASLNTAYDALAASLAKKLPLYKPNDSVFAYRNPSGEQMVKQSLKN